MASNADDICVVYCISDATCSDPHPHGYIGLTKNQALAGSGIIADPASGPQTDMSQTRRKVVTF
jgi:hypothetical protein